jgi:hypothetical protein
MFNTVIQNQYDTNNTNMTSDSIVSDEIHSPIPLAHLYRQQTCTIDRPDSPDFSFMPDTERRIMSSAYDVVHKNDFWSIVTSYSDNYFVRTEYDRVINVIDHIAKNYMKGHSPYTMSWTMRQLETIGLHGFTEYKNVFIKKITAKNSVDSSNN